MSRTAVDLTRAVRRLEISPVEVAEECLRLIEAWQPVTNAFSQLRPEETLEEARGVADRLARGTDPGVLAGVPVAIKDLYDVSGWETTGCCAAYRGRVADADADAVRRLREAGAVVVGKTNQHELAAGATNLVSACGPTRNPWDPERLTGGSSGGSGAAVASRSVPLALGTDTGGSIRIPASFCGLTGLKPTHGRVSLQGVMPLAPSFDTVGPMAADALDAGTAFAVLTGAKPPTDRGSLQDVRIGFPPDELAATTSPEVAGALASVETWLGSRSHRIDEPILDAYRPGDWDLLAWRELHDAHGHLLERPDLLGGPTRGSLEQGRDVTAGELEEARGRVEELRGSFLRVLEEMDALALPATPFPAPRLDELQIELRGRALEVRRGAISLLTRPVNMAGLPALAFPVGFTASGLPMGAQLVGRPGGEATLIGIVQAWQRETDFHLREPSGDADAPGV
jgi:Asp-tRNA(Asn)/Glu-tRNA(Gln) amidotransferase A subunit family amidase